MFLNTQSTMPHRETKYRPTEIPATIMKVICDVSQGKKQRHPHLKWIPLRLHVLWYRINIWRIRPLLSQFLTPKRCRKGWPNEPPFIRNKEHSYLKEQIQSYHKNALSKQLCRYLSLRSNMRRTEEQNTTSPTCHQYADRRFLWLWS